MRDPNENDDEQETADSLTQYETDLNDALDKSIDELQETAEPTEETE